MRERDDDQEHEQRNRRREPRIHPTRYQSIIRSRMTVETNRSASPLPIDESGMNSRGK